MSLTPAQSSAVHARGNVLVVAGAGTGKTKTLVERCLNIILGNGPERANIDEILMVTFTEAAAAEMRKRIRAHLEERSTNAALKQQCIEQLSLIDGAHIGTLHSFCLKMVRQHFYELELDPQLSVMREEEASLLASGTLDKLLRSSYAGTGDLSVRVRELIRAYGGGSDEAMRNTILQLHHYMQTLADPEAWYRSHMATLQEREPRVWQQWLLESLPNWREGWREVLAGMDAENAVAANCAALLRNKSHCGDAGELGEELSALRAAFEGCPRGKKGAWLQPLKPFQEEIEFLASLLPSKNASDALSPLEQDWEWSRVFLMTLLEITWQFSHNYAAEKQELASVDFHDLEQHALRLLWNTSENKPTAIAQEWRERLKYVFVDEYQDINNAQDKIIQALSREHPNANRFLVGDAKQSIYRFRLASPGIFRNYMSSWSGWAGSTIRLVENFRSHEGIINLTNSLFLQIMPPSLGGIDYSAQALEFGAPNERKQLSSDLTPEPISELHLIIKDQGGNEGEDEQQSEISEILDAEKEARIIAKRFLQFHQNKTPVWDDGAKAFRAVRWSDMAVLLRAPSRKAESYAKAFDHVGVPLQVAKRGFYDTIEICDVLSLLAVLDNPLQDVPMIAALRSPFANLSLEEIAHIRLAAKKARFWTALVAWHQGALARNLEEERSMLAKVSKFLEQFAKWRDLTRQSALSLCLEVILSDTCYCEWLQVQPRGSQRHANIRRFVGLAREFDQFQRRGLLRFLAYVDAQRECASEPEVAATGDCDAVRLMSIHQSKGLEFPIVAVPDMSKPFNSMDLKSDFLLSEKYGLSAQVRPPHTRRKYPSLPLWLARREEHRELLGEELRVLYVAITRARDRLVLSATISRKTLEKLQEPEQKQNPANLLRARSYADWVRLWVNSLCPVGTGSQGKCDLFQWFIHDEENQLASGAIEMPDPSADARRKMESILSGTELLAHLNWAYPHKAATLEPAKSSVSLIRRRLSEDGDAPGFQPFAGPRLPAPSIATSTLNAADRGTAHHRFLQLVSLEKPCDCGFLAREAKRLVSDGMLTTVEAAELDLDGIAEFWKTGIGKDMLRHRNYIRRELAFTVRFSATELARYAALASNKDLADEFVITQGVADLALILPDELWLVDFKTDQITANEITDRVKSYTPQIQIYSDVLSRIYRRLTTRAELYFISCRKHASVKLA